MFATARKAFGVHRAKKAAKSVKKSRLVRKRDNEYPVGVERAREIVETIIRVHKMLQDLQTKYGITREQLKRFI